MSRKIINRDEVEIYVDELVGVKPDALPISLEGTYMIWDFGFARHYQDGLAKEMVARTVGPLFFQHLTDGAKTTGVPIYGLEQMTEKSPYFHQMNERDKDIVRAYWRPLYVHELAVVPEHLRRCDYNFLYVFVPKKVSDSVRKKLEVGVRFLQEQAHEYLQDQLGSSEAKKSLFDFIPQSSWGQRADQVEIRLDYLKGQFSSLPDLFQAAEKWEKGKLKRPRSCSKQKDNLPQRGPVQRYA